MQHTPARVKSQVDEKRNKEENLGGTTALWQPVYDKVGTLKSRISF